MTTRVTWSYVVGTTLDRSFVAGIRHHAISTVYKHYGLHKFSHNQLKVIVSEYRDVDQPKQMTPFEARELYFVKLQLPNTSTSSPM